MGHAPALLLIRIDLTNPAPSSRSAAPSRQRGHACGSCRASLRCKPSTPSGVGQPGCRGPAERRSRTHARRAGSPPVRLSEGPGACRLLANDRAKRQSATSPAWLSQRTTSTTDRRPTRSPALLLVFVHLATRPRDDRRPRVRGGAAARAFAGDQRGAGRASRSWWSAPWPRCTTTSDIVDGDGVAPPVREQQAATAASASTWLPLRTRSVRLGGSDLVAASTR
jgi:hypothetical protein